jgi:dihydrofolate reductase
MISIIVAVAENGVIGSDNRLPWHLPDDLKRFKALSVGKPIVMGRRTFDSIGRPLPGRANIVISRQSGLALQGARVVHSLDEALSAAGAVPEIVVIGGAEIFRQVLPRTNTIHLTRVQAHRGERLRYPAPGAALRPERGRSQGAVHVPLSRCRRGRAGTAPP